MSPASAATAISRSRASWNIHIPAVQTPLATSCDEAAQILVASTEATSDLSATQNVHFSHLTTYGKVALSGVDTALKNVGYTGATLVSVDFKASEPIAGDWYCATADGTLTAKDPSYTITLQTPDVSDLSNITDLWFGMIPADLSGQDFTVRVNTDKGSIERTLTFPEEGFNFAAGAVNRFTVNMEGATIATTTEQVPEVVYELVTDITAITEDDDLILVNSYSNPTYAMGYTASSSSGIEALAAGSSTFTYSSEDKYIRLATDSQVEILYAYGGYDASSGICLVGYTPSSSGVLTLSSKKLTWNSSSTFYWTASVSLLGAATLSGKASSSGFGGGNSTYYITCSGGYFTVKTSSATVALFKKTIIYHDQVTENPVCDEQDAILNETEYGAYVTGTNRQQYVKGTDQLSREYDPSSYSSPTTSFSILTPGADKVLQFTGIPQKATKDNSFTLTVCRYEEGSVTWFQKYNVIVVREDGPKLWLSTGDGEGFIVKK